MRAIAIASSFLALTSVLQAAQEPDPVVVFMDACMGHQSAYETIDTLGKSRGWTQPDKKASSGNDDFASKVFGRGWIVLPPTHPSEKPKMSVLVMRLDGKPGSADEVAREMCVVTSYGYRSDETAHALQRALGADVPVHRQAGTRSATTQWPLSRDRMDGVALFEQDLRSGPVTSITRGRTLDNGLR